MKCSAPVYGLWRGPLKHLPKLGSAAARAQEFDDALPSRQFDNFQCLNTVDAQSPSETRSKANAIPFLSLN